jgi:hypothetical protein
MPAAQNTSAIAQSYQKGGVRRWSCTEKECAGDSRIAFGYAMVAEEVLARVIGWIDSETRQRARTL